MVMEGALEIVVVHLESHSGWFSPPKKWIPIEFSMGFDRNSLDLSRSTPPSIPMGWGAVIGALAKWWRD
jgi:hypothetical protein